MTGWKRQLGAYLVLVAFGGVSFALYPRLEARPEWAQWGMIGLWALIAYVFVRALLTDDFRERDDESPGPD